LTLSEAYDLAQSRGYQKSKGAFRKGIKRPDTAEQILRLFGIAKGELHNEYFDHGSKPPE
ncbi:hypothetical protein, partial [Picosynechococcus sp. PCC 7002]|uniref:hypothetical protein n=1 Tax=Picosynechococcus sp. (strain ATCC 27264 / PCC 7002 / PR-6) TaxID=32049 RepID=UPI001C3D9E0B